MLNRIFFGFLFLASFSSCLKGKTNYECNYDPCSYKAPASEIQAVKDYLDSYNITATQHCSGLFYSIENPGTGATPLACGGVRATYVGKLTDGTQFDANTADFMLNGVITGWTDGIPLIKQGGKIHLYIPPSLGYGSRSVGSIPPNSILVFDVTLDTVY
jgi:FKBP-type peptidyl-prolyl cis-trans isomerase FkpA